MSGMVVTNVTVYPCEPRTDGSDTLLGYAKVTLNGQLTLHGIRIVKSNAWGAVVKYPFDWRMKNPGNDESGHYYAPSKDLSGDIATAILDKYILCKQCPRDTHETLERMRFHRHTFVVKKG